MQKIIQYVINIVKVVILVVKANSWTSLNFLFLDFSGNICSQTLLSRFFKHFIVSTLLKNCNSRSNALQYVSEKKSSSESTEELSNIYYMKYSSFSSVSLNGS